MNIDTYPIANTCSTMESESGATTSTAASSSGISIPSQHHTGNISLDKVRTELILHPDS